MAARDPEVKIIADATDDGEQIVDASASSGKRSAVPFSQGAAGANRFGIFW
jgi:hypothetical protein